MSLAVDKARLIIYVMPPLSVLTEKNASCLNVSLGMNVSAYHFKILLIKVLFKFYVEKIEEASIITEMHSFKYKALFIFSRGRGDGG